MFLEKILDIFKKDFIHLGLDKIEIKKLQAGLNKFIKAVNFIICFRYSSLSILTKLGLLPLFFLFYPYQARFIDF